MTESYGTITITDTTDITKIENWYLASNKSSGVTVSESGWTTDVTNTNAVMTANKQYLWNYEKILGTGDVVINTTAPVIIGRYGQNGGAGKGISSIDEYYQVTNSTTNPGSSGWQKNTLVVPTASNPYLWNYQVINYVNPTSTEGTYTDARIIGVYGDKGDTGTSVLSTVKYYRLATSKPSKPTDNAAIPSGWSTTQPTFDSSKLTYTLYTVIQTTYSNGNIVYSAVQVDSSFEAAKVAYQQAITAQGIATTAQTSADGKNTIYYADGPTGPSSSTYTLKIGDTWFDTNDGNKIYRWTGSAWSATQLGQNAIADLAITNAKIANGTIQDAKIGNLDAGKITTGSLDADRIKASVISAVNSSTETSDGSSLKISANKVNIDGTAIFTNEDFQTALNNQGYQTANDVSEAISNISIGGRNLLLDTGTSHTSAGSASNSAYTAGWEQSSYFDTLNPVVDETIFTYSFDYEVIIPENTTVSDDACVYPHLHGGMPTAANTIATNTNGDESHPARMYIKDNLSGHYWITWKYTSAQSTGTVTYNRVRLYYAPDGATVKVSNIKLEIGTIPTDWTPAPEDVDGAIDIVQENLNASRSWYAECPTAAATAAKVATITPATTDFALATGTTVAVKFTYTNSVANPTLNVNETGAIAIKRYGTTAPSTSAKTSWQANSINTLTYDGTYWRLNNWLNDDTTYNLGRNLHATAIKVIEKDVASGCLMAGTESGYKKIAAGLQFSLSYPLLYASAAYTANTTYTNTYETWNSVTYPTTAAVQSAAVNKTIYLKGTVSANTFTIDSTNVFTTVEPTSADGCFYIPLGIMSNATTGVGNFSPSSSLYAFIDGRFRQVTPTEIVVSQRIYYRSYVAGTVSKPTAWIEQTGNKYNDTVSVGDSGWSTKVTPIAKSTAETTTTNKKYLFLYTCEQRKRLDGTVDCTPVLLDDSTTVIDGGNIITGTVTANQIQSGSLSIGVFGAETQNDILNSNIEIGGRNLLRNTKDYAEATYTSTCTFAKDSEGITVITFPAYTGSVGWKSVALHPNIPYTLIKDKTVTLSFWYRSDSWTLASGGHNYPLPSFEILETATSNPSGTNRLKYVTIYDATVPAPTTEWQRFVRSYNITDSFFTAGSGTVTEDRYFTIQVFQHNLSHLQYKKIQLEIGNKATDWTPASEDIDSAIDDASKVAANYIVADSTGLMVADMSGSAQTPSTATTKNVLIDSNSIDIRNGQTTLASFSADEITIGGDISSRLILCKDKAMIDYYSINHTLEIRPLDEDSSSSILLSSQNHAGQITLGNATGVGLSGSPHTYIYGGNTIHLEVGDATTGSWSDMQMSGSGFSFNGNVGSTINFSTFIMDESFSIEQIVNAIPVHLYDNANASASASVTLKETAANFDRLTIFFKDNDNNYSSVDVWSPNGKRVSLSLTWINGASTQEMYQRVRWVTISGTTISTYRASTSEKYRTGQVKLGATASVTNSDYIAIVHVLGYRWNNDWPIRSFN